MKVTCLLFLSCPLFLSLENVIAFQVSPRSLSSSRINNVQETTFSPKPQCPIRPDSSTELAFFRRLFRRRGKKETIEVPEPKTPIVDLSSSNQITMQNRQRGPKKETENTSICVIGGGVSGLTAALTAVENMIKPGKNIVVLESGETLGGRIQSDVTEDGYTLDRGFAVFIEQYPMAKKVLDYDNLKLKKFLPGALVKLDDEPDLARVADPLRQPEDVFTALFAPVGSLPDKLGLLLLIFDTRTTKTEDLFKQPEMDTLTFLQGKYGFSDSILDRFFKPFLEGIYLAPLQEQSSRMFGFIFKMFSEGAATLPEGGMGQISKQLVNKAKAAGIDLRTKQAVVDIKESNGGFLVQTQDGTQIQAKSVVVATDGKVAQKLVSYINGFESLESLPEQPQRSVGCMYYAFKGDPPVTDPILILNGIGSRRGGKSNPVNNACFPSAVNKGYAPEGYSLCSVTILKDAMEAYDGKEDELDQAVRRQLASWFPGFEYDIIKNWELKRMYKIPNAQPGQLQGPFPANVYGGRDSSKFRGKKLPTGMFVCGDHMATATLNGALESGANAGLAAAEAV